MNSQKVKNNFLPEDFTEEDELKFDYYLENSKLMFPKLVNDEWLLKMGILAYMKKEKLGDTEPPSQEEIAEIKNKYTKNTVFYTNDTIEAVEIPE